MKEVNINLEKQVAGLIHTKEQLYDQITLVKQDKDAITNENKVLLEENLQLKRDLELEKQNQI